MGDQIYGHGTTDPFASTPSALAFDQTLEYLVIENNTSLNPDNHLNPYFLNTEKNITNLLGRMTAARSFLYGTQYGRLGPPKDRYSDEALDPELELLERHMEWTFEELREEWMGVDDAIDKVRRVWAQYDWDTVMWNYGYDECPWRFG